MKNARAYEKNGFLFIKINLAKDCGESASGKSTVIAKNDGIFEDLENIEGLSIKLMLIRKKPKINYKALSTVDDDDVPLITKSKKPLKEKAVAKKRK